MFPAESTTVQLSRGELLRWQPQAALRVRVVAGRAWITWPGEADDHFLDAGEAVELPAGRHALIGAETDTRLMADAVAAVRRRSAWAALLQRLVPSF